MGRGGVRPQSTRVVSLDRKKSPRFLRVGRPVTQESEIYIGDGVSERKITSVRVVVNLR